MDCVRSWPRSVLITDEELAKFALTHELGTTEKCPVHGTQGSQHPTLPLMSRCMKRNKDKAGDCRKVLSRLAPYISLRCNANAKFRFWILLAQKATNEIMMDQLGVHPDTLWQWRKEVLQASRAFIKARNDALTFTRCAVDETKIGKRKNNAGRRPRQKPFWCVTITGVARNGTSQETIWVRVAKRDSATLIPLVKKHTVDSTRTIVYTDGWKGYLALKDIRDHRVVNHSVQGRNKFVTEDGVHTNNAESVHSVVKRALRRMGRMPQSYAGAEATLSLLVLWFKKTGWRERMQALCTALRGAKDLPWEELKDDEDDEDDEEGEEETEEEPETEEEEGEEVEEAEEDEDFRTLQWLMGRA